MTTPDYSRKTIAELHKKDDFKKFIRKRLELILPENLVDEFITPSAMKLWSRAFTDQTFDSENYELDETIGDSAINLAFYDIIIEALPSVKQPKMYSTLKEFYVSKTAFSQFSTEAGFINFLRADQKVLRNREILEKIAEDLWESYHGVLFQLGKQIGEEKTGIAIGYECVKNSMILVINNLEIEKDRAYGAFKNQLSEITSNLRIKVNSLSYPLTNEGKVAFYYYIRAESLRKLLSLLNRDKEDIEKFINDTESKNIIISIPEYQRKKNELAHMLINDIVLGSGVALTQEEAQDAAARAAVSTFRNIYKITDKEIEDQRIAHLEENIDNKDLRKAVDIIREYYPVTRINKRPFGRNILYMLLGALDNGKTEAISIILEKKQTNFDVVERKLYINASEGLKKRYNK